MILNIHDRVKVAYKKLKQMVHFEKHPLTLRRRMAEFECDAAFEERLQAACLTGLLRGAELASALEQGAGFAAAVVGWQGAFGHGAPWDEIFSG